MPSLQVVDLNPPESNPLQTTVDSFIKRRQEHRDVDELSDIYQQYQQDSMQIDKAIQSVQTNSNMSPKSRVSAAKNLIELKKTNIQLQKEQYRLDKEEKNTIAIQDQDEKERAFLEDESNNKLTGTDLYLKARKAGINRIGAHKLTSIQRLGDKEDRLTEGDISRQYDYELRDIDRQIKEIKSPSKQEPLRQERARIAAMRKRDLAAYRSGEKILVPEIQQIEAQEIEEKNNPVIMKLNQTFPPAQWKGKEKWDKERNKYKSDGEKWFLVRS